MRIAIINVTYQYGSTGQLAFNLYKNAIKNGDDAILFYGRDNAQNLDPNIIKIENAVSVYCHAFMARVTGLEGYFSYFPTKYLIKKMREFCPELVVLFNLVGYYMNAPLLFEYLNRNRIKTIYCMIDEYAYCGKCAYPGDCEKYMGKCEKCPGKKLYPESWLFDIAYKKQRMKFSSYGRREHYIFTGPEYVCERAKKSMILRDAKTIILDECIDTNVYKQYETAPLKKQLGIPEKNKIVLNVCPVSNPRKGAELYFQAIKRLEGKGISFIHVGCDTQKTEYPDNLIQVGYIYDQVELAKYMSLADVFVCSSMNDTMPNTCLEALSCGTPVIGFDIAGIPYVADSICGTFVEAGNIEKLAEAIDSAPHKENAMEEYCRNYALKRYSFEAFYRKILEIEKKHICSG